MPAAPALIATACRLDAQELKREHFFERPHLFWRRTYRHGKRRVLIVGYWVSEDQTAVVLVAIAPGLTGLSPTSFEQAIKIVERPKLAGIQRWLACPRCEAAAKSLYWVPGELGFGCRRCLRLAYPCQRLRRNRLFDDLVHHLQILSTCEARIRRANSPGAVARVVKRAVKAGTAVDRYAVSLAERVPGNVTAPPELPKIGDRSAGDVEPFSPWWKGPPADKQLELFA